MKSHRVLYLPAMALILLVITAPLSATTIMVDALHPGLAIPREMYGHNVTWYTMEKQYQGDGAMAPSLLEDYKNMGVGSLRYPGGCMADAFAWETSIGPYNTRGIQCVNGKPALAKFPASFGADEYLRLCEQLGAEPQITLEFRAPDVNTKIQAESAYTIATNTLGEISVDNLALDDGSSVSFPGKGDEIIFSFSIPRDGYYKLVLCNRAGSAGDSTHYWKTNAYSYLLDGAAFTFTNDASTVSPVDSKDGQTTWGTIRSGVIRLGYGKHELKLTAKDTSLKVDYLEVQELNHMNSVKRGMAWIAYCNGDPGDTRPIGVDTAGVDWKTVGYWAQKRVDNGHPEPYAVKYWEVANEAWGPDPYGSPPDRNPVPYNNGWIDYYNAAKTIDPNLRLSLCGYSPSDWTNSLLQTHGDKANYIHFHPYQPNMKKGPEPYQLYLAGVSSYKGVQTYIDQYKDAIKTSQPSRVGKIKGSASEWSACYGWSDWQHNSWSAKMSAVLTVADQLGTMTNNTDLMESAQFWHSYGPNTYTIFTEYSNTDYFKQGIYEAFKLYGNYFGEVSLPASVSADCPTYHFDGHRDKMPAGDYPMLTAYASQDSSNYYLVVINKDPQNAQSAKLNWQGLAGCKDRVTVRTISSTDPLPNYTSMNGPEASPIKTATSFLETFQPSMSYTFPACSVTGFVVERTEPSNRVWYREAEDIFTAYTDAPPYNTIATESYGSQGYVRMGTAGDCIVIPFNIRKKGTYTIRIKNRCKKMNIPGPYWNNNACKFYLNGDPVTSERLNNPLAPIDAGVFWGTSELKGQTLDYGRHYLKIKANVPGVMIDWISVEELKSSTEAKN